ncbi:Vigilin [Portunus trituberculatus]|uniref:Vigilin n=1 Tax=Portunus trituberculatus TaxID=210409 RepID=A0A5B7HBH0_PORTR|nr:Vigilin [Portunus trituberculatus]
MVQTMDCTGGDICLTPEDWEAILPAPLDTAAIEEDNRPVGCGCLRILRRLFRRKKKSRTANEAEQKAEETIQSREESNGEAEETVGVFVTRAIVHVDAVQDEDTEEEFDLNSSEIVEPEAEGEVKAPTTAVPGDDLQEGAGEGSKDHEGERKAAAAVAGMAHLPGEDHEAATEGWTVVRRRRKRRPRKAQVLPSVPERKPASKELAPRAPQARAAPSSERKDGSVTPSALPSMPERKPAAEQQAPRAPQARAVPRSRRKDWSATQRPSNSVRCSWQEEVAEAAVLVVPFMRRYIVGPRGATLQKIHQLFAGVRVTVPLPKDAVTTTVRVRGPPRQVTAAVAHLKALLHEAEVVEAQVAVTPHQRRHVVGHRGATAWELQQQFPAVSVMVPPPADLESRSVLLRGPRSQVSGAQAFLQARLQAARTDTRRARTSRRQPHAHAHTPASQ